MTFTEYEKLISGLYVLFQEYVESEIEEISIANIVSCVGIAPILRYLDDLRIGYGDEDVIVTYPENDDIYAKDKVNLLYKTLVRKNRELNESNNL